MNDNFDIIVVGAGHAGCEAAAIAAKLGAKVLLITIDMTKIAQMSCNPSIGGIGKGQLVREIDALGGTTALITDKTMIQFRMLNKSKGPAMWSPRSQNDRMRFSYEWRKYLENLNNVYFWQDSVRELIIENNTVKGVITQWGVRFYAKAVIITAGTFLNGRIYIADKQINGGRIGEPNSTGLTEQLSSFGIPTNRMKTGTPVRIDGRSIDFSKLEPQYGDEPPGKFSYDIDSKMILPSLPCYLVYTNKEVHNELKKGFRFSPLFNGTIKGIGPRYCPSIEDKLVTFSDKERHLLFLEPEGVDTYEYYLNGFSSSLPIENQYNALKKINGFENIKIFRPGYAIEYDYFDPIYLNHTLESKIINNLFFAGQVNGTTGYEEAAAQGLVAGINAVQKIRDQHEFILSRNEAYIGVLIDDLVTKGVDEPYRMFTSRAEHRILLRQDNADIRLFEIAKKFNLIENKRIENTNQKIKLINYLQNLLENTSITPDEINNFLEKNNSNKINQSYKISKIISRPEINIIDFYNNFSHIFSSIDFYKFDKYEILQTVETDIKYSFYIQKEHEIINKINRLNNLRIPKNIDYNSITSLSIEARQKLSKIQPETIYQASLIPGITPSDINILLIYLGR